MADEAELVIETHLPIPFTKATGTAFEQGEIPKMTTGMVAATSVADSEIPAGVVKTEVTAAEASPSVSIFRGGIFRGTAGVAGVTCGEAIQIDTATSSINRLVDADVNSEQIVGTCLETATSGNQFLFELNPRSIDVA